MYMYVFSCFVCLLFTTRLENSAVPLCDFHCSISFSYEGEKRIVRKSLLHLLWLHCFCIPFLRCISIGIRMQNLPVSRETTCFPRSLQLQSFMNLSNATPLIFDIHIPATTISLLGNCVDANSLSCNETMNSIQDIRPGSDIRGRSESLLAKTGDTLRETIMYYY